jgi:hypothetical protein
LKLRNDAKAIVFSLIFPNKTMIIEFNVREKYILQKYHFFFVRQYIKDLQIDAKPKPEFIYINEVIKNNSCNFIIYFSKTMKKVQFILFSIFFIPILLSSCKKDSVDIVFKAGISMNNAFYITEPDTTKTIFKIHLTADTSKTSLEVGYFYTFGQGGCAYVKGTYLSLSDSSVQIAITADTVSALIINYNGPTNPPLI